MHVLPKGFHRIRHCGLLASSAKTETIARARELIAAATPAQTAQKQQAPDSATGNQTHPCPCCGGRMNIIETFGLVVAAEHSEPLDDRRQHRDAAILPGAAGSD